MRRPRITIACLLSLLVFASALPTTTATPEVQKKGISRASEKEFAKQWEMVKSEAPLVAIAYLKAVKAVVATTSFGKKPTISQCEIFATLNSVGGGSFIDVFGLAKCKEKERGEDCPPPDVKVCRTCYLGDFQPGDIAGLLACQMEKARCDTRNETELALYRRCRGQRAPQPTPITFKLGKWIFVFFELE